MHRIKGDAIRKVLIIEDKPHLVEVSGDAQGLTVRSLNGAFEKSEAEVVENIVRYWFDADRDLQPFYELLNNYPPLAYMTTAFSGLRLIAMPDLFETLAWAVIGQQINLVFACKLKRRLVERYCSAMVYDSEPYLSFPSPDVIAKADADELRGMQFSAGKAAYLIGIAKAFECGELSAGLLHELPDLASRQEKLKAIKGIGTWTANYALMKCLREPSCIPYGDAGLHNALKAHGIIKDKTETEAMQQLFDRFAGWESYLVFYLWRSLSDPG